MVENIGILFLHLEEGSSGCITFLYANVSCNGGMYKGYMCVERTMKFLLLNIVEWRFTAHFIFIEN